VKFRDTGTQLEIHEQRIGQPQRLAVSEGGVALALGTAACDNTARGVRDDAAQNKQAAAEQAEKAKAQARETADEAKRASGQAGAAIDAAKETIDVKAAARQAEGYKIDNQLVVKPKP